MQNSNCAMHMLWNGRGMTCKNIETAQTFHKKVMMKVNNYGMISHDNWNMPFEASNTWVKQFGRFIKVLMIIGVMPN
jgi:hypothetical protein